MRILFLTVCAEEVPSRRISALSPNPLEIGEVAGFTLFYSVACYPQAYRRAVRSLTLAPDVLAFWLPNKANLPVHRSFRFWVKVTGPVSRLVLTWSEPHLTILILLLPHYL